MGLVPLWGLHLSLPQKDIIRWPCVYQKENFHLTLKLVHPDFRLLASGTIKIKFSV